jgi:RNA polymerase II-associated factor 1
MMSCSIAIQAPLHPPVPHPHDRALLKPLSTLGKPKFSDSGVSFLRRTEYISSHSTKTRFDTASPRSAADTPGVRFKRPAANVDKESPEYIKSRAVKSFGVAASNLKDGKAMRHPTNRNLKLVGSYPLIPDLDAFPDAGGYMTLKFLTNPVPPSTTYDARLEKGLWRPVQLTEEQLAAQEAAKEAHILDPENNPAPDDAMEYEYFLPETAEQASQFKRKFDVLDPEKDSDELYPRTNDNGEKAFRFKKIRPYETASQTGSAERKYDDEVLIAIYDGTDGVHQRAAYYYPILQRAAVRPQRTRNIHKHRIGVPDQDEKETLDFLDVQVEDQSDEQKAYCDVFREQPLGGREAAEEDEHDEVNGRSNEAGTEEDRDEDHD